MESIGRTPTDCWIARGLAGIGLVCFLLPVSARRLAHAEDCPTRSCNFQRTGLVEDSGLLPPLVLKWSVDTSPWGAPDPLIYACPVIYDGTVYLAHRVDSWVLAFDALSGSVKWSKRVSGNCTLGGEIYQPTVTADGIFLVRYAEPSFCTPWMESGARALDFNGNPLWSEEAGYDRGFCCSPLVVGGRVYVPYVDYDKSPYKAYLAAYELTTGQTAWRYEMPGTRATRDGDWLWFPPAWDGQRIYVAGTVIAALEDGGDHPVIKWEYDWGQPTQPGCPTVANEKVYVQGDNTLYAIDKRTGALTWTFTCPALIPADTSSLAVIGRVVYVLAIPIVGSSGTLYAVEDLGGSSSLKWEKPISCLPNLGGINSVANGVLYLQENASPSYALEGRSMETGEVVWSFSSPGDSQPAIGSGLLFDYSAPFMRCWGRPVSLHIKADKASALPGDLVSYVLTANAYGGPASANMMIVETVPPELEFVSATGGGGQVGSMMIWQGLTILKDTLLSVTLTGRVRRDLAMGTYDVVGQGFLDYPGLPGDATECMSGRVHTVVVQSTPPPPAPYRGRVRVYPNPFSPARAVRGTVKFEGLPMGAKVRVYTPRGLRVWEGSVVTPYLVEWDGKSETGKPVAPGAYQWVAEGEEGKEHGTLIIE